MANPNDTKCLDGKFTRACLQNNTNSRWRGSEVKKHEFQKRKKKKKIIRRIRNLVRLKMREMARCSEDALTKKILKRLMETENREISAWLPKMP